MQLFIDLIFYFFIVILLGGIVILGLKVAEWFLDQSETSKIQKQNSNQKYLFIKLDTPENADLPIENMEKLLKEAHIINDDIRSDKSLIGYTNLIWEIHACGGKYEVYAAVEKSRMRFLKSWLNLHYSNLIVQDTDDPTRNWPKDWRSKRGVLGVKGLKGSEIILKNSDVFPLESWETFGTEKHEDPLQKLMAYLKTVSSDAYIIVQFLFKPYENDKESAWQKEQEAIENDLQGKDEELTLVRSIIKSKTTSLQYRFKIRWLAIYNSQSRTFDDKKVHEEMMAYLKAYQTPYQELIESLSINTDSNTSTNSNDDFINSLIKNSFGKSNLEDKILRKRTVYQALLSRNPATGTNEFYNYLDLKSIAGLFHLTTNMYKEPSQNPNNPTDSGQSNFEEYPQPEVYTTGNFANNSNDDQAEDIPSKLLPPYNLPT